MAREKISGIYKITNKINKKVYVGQSIDICKRWHEHKNDFKSRRDRHNIYFQRAWDKYGEDNFIFEIIESCTKYQLDKRERYWIKYYNSSDTSFGYNADEGANGRVINAETKFKMGASNRGKPKNTNKIVQLSLDGSVIKIWDNLLEISNNFTKEISCIRKCCNKQGRKSSNGFVWVYLDEYKSDNFDFSYYTNKRICTPIPVVMMDLNYNYIKEFESKNQAAKELNLPVQNIDENVIGKRSRVKDYMFISKENYDSGIKSLFTGRKVSVANYKIS